MSELELITVAMIGLVLVLVAEVIRHFVPWAKRHPLITYSLVYPLAIILVVGVFFPWVEDAWPPLTAYQTWPYACHRRTLGKATGAAWGGPLAKRCLTTQPPGLRH